MWPLCSPVMGTPGATQNNAAMSSLMCVQFWPHVAIFLDNFSSMWCLFMHQKRHLFLLEDTALAQGLARWSSGLVSAPTGPLSRSLAQDTIRTTVGGGSDKNHFPHPHFHQVSTLLNNTPDCCRKGRVLTDCRNLIIGYVYT